MLHIIFVILTISFSGTAAAQRNQEAAVPPASASGHTASPDQSQKNAVLTSVANGCVRPGDILAMQGRNLDNLGDRLPALEQGTAALPLEVLSRTDHRIVTRLPAEGIALNRNYRIVLAGKETPYRFERTSLDIRICPLTSAEASSESESRSREILIFAAVSQSDNIRMTLRAKNIITLRQYDLSTLKSVLIVIPGDQGMIDDLRPLFPGADIDFNDDLAAAGSPRVYAKDKIKWPDEAKCLEKAVEMPIGLIDGSIDLSHPAFSRQRITEKNFTGDYAADMDHATAIASILVGNWPEQGYDGLLKGAKLYNAVALRSTSGNAPLASVEATLRGLDWLMSKDVRLINVSLAGAKNQVLVRSFEAALARGTLVFAAAGNNGPSSAPVYPAAIDGVFAITAVDASGRAYNASNQGKYIDFSAPGVDVWAAAPDAAGIYRSGTSYAVPHALAVAALYLGWNPNLSSAILQRNFLSTARDLGTHGHDAIFGNGLLQGQCPVIQ